MVARPRRLPGDRRKTGAVTMGWSHRLTAAIYLALRWQPRPRRGAVLIPVVAGALVLLGLIALLLAPFVAARAYLAG